MSSLSHPYSIAIACGGTGGHLFPGLAIAEKLADLRAKMTLIISKKEVDQQAIHRVTDCQILALPAVGFHRAKAVAFLRGFRDSYLITKRLFRHHTPDAVIAMGGFTSAAPILAGKAAGARTFLHESNAIPGRANRWLSRFVDHAFVGFPMAGERLSRCPVKITGTPVRSQFQPRDRASCRAALGFDRSRPMIVVVGGSQGACGINRIIARCLPMLARLHPEWQWFHVTGSKDAAIMKVAYARLGLKAVVHTFFDHMELALGGATLAISRAGASSLAELAALSVPALLIPYPAAADNHQWFNAQEFVKTGAAEVISEREANEERVVGLLKKLAGDQTLRQNMEAALVRWQRPDAADEITRHIVNAIQSTQERLTFPEAGSRRLFPVRTIAMNGDEMSASLEQHTATRAQEQPARI